MSKNNAGKISVFVADGKTYVVSDFRLSLSQTFLVDKDGKRIPAQEIVKGSPMEKIATLFFDHSFDSDSIVRVRTFLEYGDDFSLITKNEQLKKSINQNTWDMLPESLQALYRKKKVEKEEIFTFDVTFVDFGQFSNESVFLYTPEEVRLNIDCFNFINNKYARAYAGKVYKEDSQGRTYSEEVIGVDFFERDYNGETTKILKKKSNGQPYADRRGKIVKDYPHVSFHYHIPLSEIPRLYASSQEELRKEMQKYIDHITLTSQLNQSQ